MIETLTKQAKQKIYQRLIEPLEKEDQKHESSLLETINTYFQSNKNNFVDCHKYVCTS